MNNVISKAISLITDDKASCVVIRNGQIEELIHASGIAPVMKLYNEGTLKDAFIVDKIIGKAAAMILTHGEISGCYGVTMSSAAVEWLKDHHVSYEYGSCVSKIINRTGDGICPMEQTVQMLNDEKEAIAALQRKMNELRAAAANVKNTKEESL